MTLIRISFLALSFSLFGFSVAHADLVRSNFNKGELAKLCQDAIAKAQSQLDGLAKISAKDRTFDNTVLSFENINADLSDAAQPLSFMKYVSPNKDINAEAADCEQKLGDFGVKTFGRRDLYVALKDEKPGDDQQARLLKKTLEAFEANGLKLPDDKLAQVTALLSKLNELQTSFTNNLNKDETTVELTADELKGVSKDVLSRLKKAPDGKSYIVTTKITDYLAVMQNAKSEDARKKMMIAYNNRQGVANTKILEDAILVREQVAALMGYKTWADEQLSHNRMAKDADTVMSFLNGLREKLAKRDREDIAQLLKFKRSIDPKATEVKAWDIPYLSYQLEKRDYKLDDELIRQYFPSDQVVKAVFEVYSKLLGVRFEEVKDGSWSSDVKLYQIFDNRPDHPKNPIGYFYTDFIPRPGKYEHFASFTILSGRQLPNGTYNQPISAIVGNFNPPANGKPSLLNHEEVVTIFHEFGHVMHQTLTRVPYESLSGSSVAQDFVEAPSQMLENWPWEEKILNLLSGHYKNPSKKLPKELLKKMIAARDFQQGYFYTRQLMLALLDMTYHTTPGPVDTVAVYEKLYKDLIGVEPIHGGHFAASFGHLMGGYDAGYYGYLWSEVYAEDMFSIFKSTGVLNPETGGRYRRVILENGNMADASDLLPQFLGRPSNNKAFLKKLHIKD